MDIYETIESCLAARQGVEAWPDMLAVIRRACQRRPKAWQMPLVACAAVGGRPEQAVPAATAVAGLQISIILLDDVLDDDPRGEHRRLGGPVASNLAVAFQAASLDSLMQADAPAGVLLASARCLNVMALKTAWGQHLDMLNLSHEHAYWEVVRAKSTPFFVAALEAGALLGGATPTTAAGIGLVGRLYGEMVQIHDDLQDAMETPANPDWLLGKSSLPILFAQTVSHPEQARFQQLRASAHQAECLAEAQAILIRCGALSYSLHALLERHEAALSHLQALALPRPDGLRLLLDEAIAPIRALGPPALS